MELTFDSLSDQLSKGVVSFSFIKLDGSEREARGTTNKDYLEHKTSWRPKGRVASSKVLCFYDLDKDEWRCISRESKITKINGVIKPFDKNGNGPVKTEDSEDGQDDDK